MKKAFFHSLRKDEFLPCHKIPKPQVAPHLLIASSSTDYFETSIWKRQIVGYAPSKICPSVLPVSQESICCVLVISIEISCVQLRLFRRGALHKIPYW